MRLTLPPGLPVGVWHHAPSPGLSCWPPSGCGRRSSPGLPTKTPCSVATSVPSSQQALHLPSAWHLFPNAARGDCAQKLGPSFLGPGPSTS